MTEYYFHTGIAAHGGRSRYTEEDDGDTSVFVKYNRVLHGQERRRGRRTKNEKLTIKFLKKYIYYAKNRVKPRLTDEVVFKYVYFSDLHCYFP